MPEIPENFADAVRSAYGRPVDDATAERHVAAMVREAREVADPPSAPLHAPAPRRRRALRPALAAGLALIALPGGLAVAGVKLPEAATAPYDLVGVDLPNQASDTAEENVPDAVPARRAPAPREAPATPAPAAPAVPDGGLREGHGADDARRGERRSEERSHGRRGDERRRENRPKTDPQPAPKAIPPSGRGERRGGTTKPRAERAAPRRSGRAQRTTPANPSVRARPRTTPARPARPQQRQLPPKPEKRAKQPKAAEPVEPAAPLEPVPSPEG